MVLPLQQLDCTIYMGEEDTRRQALNVFRMELLGAKVVPVSKGQGRLKDAVDEALNDLMKTHSICLVQRLAHIHVQASSIFPAAAIKMSSKYCIC